MEEENTGEAENLRHRSPTEPLRRALHGGPGTGKSHLLRLVRTELFDGVLRWQQAVQYKVVAAKKPTEIRERPRPAAARTGARIPASLAMKAP